MSKEPISLRVTGTDSRDGFVIVVMEGPDGEPYEVRLNTMDVASLMASVRAQLDEAIASHLAGSLGMPGMQWVQYAETPETVFFRIFLSDGLFHEYPAPRNTTLAAELKAFGDRVEARNLAKATHSPPDTSSRN